jgi:hypothetical protein
MIVFHREPMPGHRVTAQNVNLTRIHGPKISGHQSRRLIP